MIFAMDNMCYWQNFPAWILLRQRQNKIEQLSKKSPKTVADKTGKKPLRCRFCQQRITTASSQIAVNGQVSHSFKNPSGIEFHINCYMSAPGCQHHGEPTREYTWFPGFSWCYAFCSKCLSHLGWFYQGPDRGFYGLIIDHLLEGDQC